MAFDVTIFVDFKSYNDIVQHKKKGKKYGHDSLAKMLFRDHVFGG